MYENFNKKPVPLPVQSKRNTSEQLQGSAAAVDLPVRSHSEKKVFCTEYGDIDTARCLYQDAVSLEQEISLMFVTQLWAKCLLVISRGRKQH